MDQTSAHAIEKEDGLSALRDLCYRVEEYAQITRDVVAAFDSEDIDGVLSAALRSRQARADIARARANYDKRQAPQSAKALELMVRIREATQTTQEGEELLKGWSHREIPQQDALLKSDTGALVFAEAMLPLVWDFVDDVVLLIGSGLERVAAVLCALGQERVIAFAPEDIDLDGYPSDVLVARTPDHVYSIIRGYAPKAAERIIIRIQDDSGVDEDLLERTRERAHDAVRDCRVFNNTLTVFADIWLSQGIANLPVAASVPSLASFREKFKGKPMVVVAPGPSLKKNVDFLHEIKGRAIIVTFSHTLKALHAAGIAPDMVVTVDSNCLQYHFDGCDLESVGAMVTGLTCHPDLYDLSAQRHFAIGANAAIDAWLFEALKEDALVPAGGSVATTAFALGLRLQCDPIICMGLDLSFPGGRYYVDTSCDGDLKVQVSDDGRRISLRGWSDGCEEMRKATGIIAADDQPLYELDGYYGGKVPTSFIFSMFHTWFEAAARNLKGDVQLVNATEGGCYIKDMEHISLREAYDKYLADIEPFDVAAVMDEAIAETDFRARQEVVLEQLERMDDSVQRSVTLARQAMRWANKAQDQRSAMSRLDVLEAELVESMKGVSFISMLRQKEIYQALGRARSAVTVGECLDGSRDLFEVIIEAGNKVSPMIRASVDELRQRLGMTRSIRDATGRGVASSSAKEGDYDS